jgi:hypothetical protein
MMEPDIDTAAGEYAIDGEAELLDAYVRVFERHFAKNYTSKHLPPRRAIHAKSHALLTGTLDVLDTGDPELRHGIFRSPASYSVAVRISNGDGPAGPDTDRIASVGFAVKVFGITLPKYDAGQRDDTQDLMFLNQPAYIASDVRDYMTLMQAIDGGVVGKIVALVRNFKGLRYRLRALPKGNPLGTRFWGVAPFRLHDVVVKYLLRPVDARPETLPRPLTPDYLRGLIKDWIERRPAMFELFLQKRLRDGNELRRMPIEDYAVAWDEEQSVPILAGRLSIPAQRVDADFEKTYGEPMVFSPWNTTSDFRPLGSLNRARRVIYQLSASMRGGATVSPFAR